MAGRADEFREAVAGRLSVGIRRADRRRSPARRRSRCRSRPARRARNVPGSRRRCGRAARRTPRHPPARRAPRRSSAISVAVRKALAVATTSDGALDLPGSSAGASGSSQSPNWKPVSHTPVGREHPGDAACVRGHERVGVAQCLLVAVRLPERPRHPDRGVSPHGGGAGLGKASAQVLHDVRHHDWHRVLGRSSSLELGIHQPVREERLDVAEERRRRREDGEVARPAEALVALRTVGGHAEEVALHAPLDVAVQLIEQRVGALERCRSARCRCRRRPPSARRGRSRPASR